eukprot:7377431-Prymnesium_polylepis.3
MHSRIDSACSIVPLSCPHCGRTIDWRFFICLSSLRRSISCSHPCLSSFGCGPNVLMMPSLLWRLSASRRASVLLRPSVLMRTSAAFSTSGSYAGRSVWPTSRENTSTSPVPLVKVFVSSWQPWKPSLRGHRLTPGNMWSTGCSCRRSLGMPRQQRSSHQYWSSQLTPSRTKRRCSASRAGDSSPHDVERTAPCQTIQ